jgi:ABC-type cobalamin/Fe3+-siderophores transport system ATPase subunit
MRFTVLPPRSRPPFAPTNVAYLITDNWDDWFEFETLYSLVLIDDKGEKQDIGGVKIGQFNMAQGQRRPNIPNTFESLSPDFFSLGQDDSFYDALNKLGDELRDTILLALNDIAKKEDLYERSMNERVTKVSLLRSVSPASIKGQFRRLANGGARLSRFTFSYQIPKVRGNVDEPIKLDFDVEPESNPPTNIHVLIGRNGVGKTYLINNMINSLVDTDASTEKFGKFISDNAFERDELFANVVSVTFSAFDESEPPQDRKDKSAGIQYSYIGLKRAPKGQDINLAPKSPVMLKNEFVKSVQACRVHPKIARWTRAIEMLEVDPIFREADVASIMEVDEEEQFKSQAGNLFKNLSSGHKIVLLTITRLVEEVEEKSLVLLDEPEAHLHPPLLAAFIRTLSDLLIQRNGVGIIATHSPVVLQEVPRSCAWKLRRSGNEVSIERLETESFGESVGILTSEVFGLEVTDSGFHRLLTDAVEREGGFEEAVASFSDHLGMEAKAILRALFSIKPKQE